MAMQFTVLIDKERCKGCELCVTACPCAVLEMTDALNAKGYRTPRVAEPERCTGCTNCALMCPDAAIEIEKAPAARQDPPAPQPAAPLRTGETS